MVVEIRVGQHFSSRLGQIEHSLVPVPEFVHVPVNYLVGVVKGGRRRAAPGLRLKVWAAGWNPDRLIFMFQAALLVSYQSCSASFGVRY